MDSRSIFGFVAILALAAGAAVAQPLEVSGRVVDARGEGIAEATVEIRPLLPAHRLAERQLAGEPTPTPALARRSRSDRDGEFLIAAPAAGFWTVVVRHPGHLPARHDLVPLLADRRLADVALPRRSELAARLVDSGGELLSGVTLRVVGWSESWRQASAAGWWPETRLARTGAGGLVALPCGSGEEVTIAARTEDGFLHREASCEAGLLELLPEAGMRASRLLDAGGVPAAGAHGFLKWPFLAFGVIGEDGRILGPMTPQDDVEVAFAGASGYFGEPRWLPPAEDDEEGALTSLLLPPAVTVRGRVVDAFDQTSVDGVWLWLDRGPRYFQTVADGVFEVRAPATAALRFGGHGYLTIAYRPPPGGGELVARMAPAMTLAGRVVDSGGAGIAGAEIGGDKVRRVTPGLRQRELQGGGYWQLEEIMATSGEGGYFELRRLAPARRFELRVARQGYAARHQAVSPIFPGEPTDELVIVLQRAFSGFGRVLNEREMPIGGAEVSLLPSLTGAAMEQDFEVKESYQTATDADGWYHLRDLPAGTYYLAAKAAGFPELLVPGIEVVASEEAIDLGTLILVPGVLLSGRVVDAEGQPVAAAELSVRNADGEQIVVQRATSAWFASAASRQNGSFHFEGLPRDSRLMLLVVADSFLTRQVAVTTGDADQRLTVELSRGARVSGLVLDAVGRPAAGAAVSLRPAGAQQSLSTVTSRTVEAGDGGRFEAAGLRPGEYDIAARSGDAESEPLRRRLATEGLADLVLELRPKASLAVSVVDGQGQPVAQVFVRLMPEASLSPEGRRPRRGGFQSTGTAGATVFTPLDAGVYRVAASHSELGSVEATVEVSDGAAQELELRLAGEGGEPRRRVAGRVIDGQGQPVSGARVWLEDARDRRATTAADGAFELQAAPGEYRLGCSHPGFAVHTGEPFTLGDADVTGLQVELESGTTVRGRITGLEPEELSRVTVVARGPYRRTGDVDVFGHRYGVVDFEGEVRIDGLGAGEWQVRAELLNPTRSAAERVEIDRGGGEVRVDLHFEAGYLLTGSVLRLGVPVAGAVVGVRCRGEFQGETFTGDGGRFAVDHVPAARCTARATDSESGDAAEQQLEVATDAEIVLELGSDGG